MSMVVSNAWKTPFKNMEDIISWAQSIRPEIKNLAQKKFDDIVVNLTMSIINSIVDTGKLPDKIDTIRSERFVSSFEPNYELCWLVAQEVYLALNFQQNSVERNPVFDFQCDVVFIPYDGIIYAIWFGDEPAFMKLVDSTPSFEDFYYDGRSDGGEEYSAREKIWSNVFDKFSTPSDVGVTVDLLPNKPYEFSQKSIQVHVTEELRQWRITRTVGDTLAYRAWLEIGDNKAKTQKLIDDGKYFSATEEYRDWKKSEEGVAMISQITSDYDSKFPSTEKLIKYFSMKPNYILEDLGGING